VRDDVLRLTLWAGVIAGAVMAAAAMGDEAHLMCLLYAGLAVTASSLLMLLRQVIIRKCAPAVQVVQVTDISDAPGALAMATGNAERIGELATQQRELRLRADIADDRVRVLTRLVRLMGGGSDQDRDETSPMRCLAVVPEVHEGKPGEGSQAGLCSVRLAALALVLA
jgi:hypothetical protein